MNFVKSHFINSY